MALRQQVITTDGLREKGECYGWFRLTVSLVTWRGERNTVTSHGPAATQADLPWIRPISGEEGSLTPCL